MQLFKNNLCVDKAYYDSGVDDPEVIAYYCGTQGKRLPDYGEAYAISMNMSQLGYVGFNGWPVQSSTYTSNGMAYFGSGEVAWTGFGSGGVDARGVCVL